MSGQPMSARRSATALHSAVSVAPSVVQTTGGLRTGTTAAGGVAEMSETSTTNSAESDVASTAVSVPTKPPALQLRPRRARRPPNLYADMVPSVDDDEVELVKQPTKSSVRIANMATNKAIKLFVASAIAREADMAGKRQLVSSDRTLRGNTTRLLCRAAEGTGFIDNNLPNTTTATISVAQAYLTNKLINDTLIPSNPRPTPRQRAGSADRTGIIPISNEVVDALTSLYGVAHPDLRRIIDATAAKQQHHHWHYNSHHRELCKIILRSKRLGDERESPALMVHAIKGVVAWLEHRHVLDRILCVKIVKQNRLRARLEVICHNSYDRPEIVRRLCDCVPLVAGYRMSLGRPFVVRQRQRLERERRRGAVRRATGLVHTDTAASTAKWLQRPPKSASVRVASINVNSFPATDSEKQAALYEYANDYNLDVLCIQETHCAPDRLAETSMSHALPGYRHYPKARRVVNPGARGEPKGGILTYVKRSILVAATNVADTRVERAIASVCAHHNVQAADLEFDVMGTTLVGDDSTVALGDIHILNVYGPARVSQAGAATTRLQHTMCSEVLAEVARALPNVIIMGDINAIVNEMPFTRCRAYGPFIRLPATDMAGAVWRDKLLAPCGLRSLTGRHDPCLYTYVMRGNLNRTNILDHIFVHETLLGDSLSAQDTEAHLATDHTPILADIPLAPVRGVFRLGEAPHRRWRTEELSLKPAVCESFQGAAAEYLQRLPHRDTVLAAAGVAAAAPRDRATGLIMPTTSLVDDLISTVTGAVTSAANRVIPLQPARHHRTVGGRTRKRGRYLAHMAVNETGRLGRRAFWSATPRLAALRKRVAQAHARSRRHLGDAPLYAAYRDLKHELEGLVAAAARAAEGDWDADTRLHSKEHQMRIYWARLKSLKTAKPGSAPAEHQTGGNINGRGNKLDDILNPGGLRDGQTGLRDGLGGQGAVVTSALDGAQVLADAFANVAADAEHAGAAGAHFDEVFARDLEAFVEVELDAVNMARRAMAVQVDPHLPAWVHDRRAPPLPPPHTPFLPPFATSTGGLHANQRPLSSLELTKAVEPIEVKMALQKLHNDKAPGDDNVPIELFKYGGEPVREALARLYTLMLMAGRLPAEWKLGRVIALLKDGGDRAKACQYRSITILRALAKVFAKINAQRMARVLNGVLSPAQTAYKPWQGTEFNLFVLNEFVMECDTQKRDCAIVTMVDLRRAFDSVWRPGLYYQLLTAGASAGTVAMIRAFYEDAQSYVQLGEAASAKYHLPLGVRQGCCMSPLLFTFYIDGLLRGLRALPKADGVASVAGVRTAEMMFSDDLVLINHTVEDTNAALDYIKDYCRTWRLVVNSAKSYVQVIGRHPVDLVRDPVRYDGVALRRVDDQKGFKYLGLCINGSFTAPTPEPGVRPTRRLRLAQSISAGIKERYGKARAVWQRVFLRDLRVGALRNVYVQAVRSAMDFGQATIVLPLGKYDELNLLQNEDLRRLARAPQFAPLVGLQGELGIEPVAGRARALQAGLLQHLARGTTLAVVPLASQVFEALLANTPERAAAAPRAKKRFHALSILNTLETLHPMPAGAPARRVLCYDRVKDGELVKAAESLSTNEWRARLQDTPSLSGPTSASPLKDRGYNPLSTSKYLSKMPKRSGQVLLLLRCNALITGTTCISRGMAGPAFARFNIPAGASVDTFRCRACAAIPQPQQQQQQQQLQQPPLESPEHFLLHCAHPAVYRHRHDSLVGKTLAEALRATNDTHYEALHPLGEMYKCFIVAVNATH